MILVYYLFFFLSLAFSFLFPFFFRFCLARPRRPPPPLLLSYVLRVCFMVLLYALHTRYLVLVNDTIHNFFYISIFLHFPFLCRLILVVLTDIYILFTIFFSAPFSFIFHTSFHFVSVRVLGLCVLWSSLCLHVRVRRLLQDHSIFWEIKEKRRKEKESKAMKWNENKRIWFR